jgi:hypothetical protein
VLLDGLVKLKKKINDLIGNRIRDFPACSIVHSASITTLMWAPVWYVRPAMSVDPVDGRSGFFPILVSIN